MLRRLLCSLRPSAVSRPAATVYVVSPLALCSLAALLTCPLAPLLTCPLAPLAACPLAVARSTSTLVVCSPSDRRRRAVPPSAISLRKRMSVSCVPPPSTPPPPSAPPPPPPAAPGAPSPGYLDCGRLLAGRRSRWSLRPNSHMPGAASAWFVSLRGLRARHERSSLYLSSETRGNVCVLTVSVAVPLKSMVFKYLDLLKTAISAIIIIIITVRLCRTNDRIVCLFVYLRYIQKRLCICEHTYRKKCE